MKFLTSDQSVRSVRGTQIPIKVLELVCSEKTLYFKYNIILIVTSQLCTNCVILIKYSDNICVSQYYKKRTQQTN